MRILSKTGAGDGSSLRMQMEISEQLYMVLYQKSEWNAIVRKALYAGGMKWLTDYLPLRFTNYAKSQLGYAAKVTRRPNSPYSAKNIRWKLPLVDNGDLMATALSQSRVESAATSTRAYADIHIATGHTRTTAKGASTPYYTQPLVYRTLSTVTEREIGVIARTVEMTITALVAGSDGSISRKGTVRRALTSTQRSSVGLSPTRRTNTKKTAREPQHV